MTLIVNKESYEKYRILKKDQTDIQFIRTLIALYEELLKETEDE